MEILIVDDEPLARQRLARMLTLHPEHNLAGEAEHAEAALLAIEELDPDVILLDIRMPGRDGLALAREISALDCPPAIIFCTAYDQYALDAFGTTAIGYLLKPVRQEQLQEALNKAQKLNKAQRSAAQSAMVATKPSRSHISAKTRRGIELIALEDVRYFVADNKYVTLFHRGGEHLLDETLKELEQEFEGRFIRIHRNTLVSAPHIEAIERSSQGQHLLRLADTQHKPLISRRHVLALKELLREL
jgi:two-component system response regulator AlgR